MNTSLIKTGLDMLYYSGAHRVMAPYTSGIGALFTLHHVRPPRDAGFQPNHILEVTPAFLESFVRSVKARGYDFVSLDEAFRRLVLPLNARPFVSLTFDDGYRDNFEYAYPILKRHKIPFTIYITSSFCDGEGELWWVALERVIAKAPVLELTFGGEDHFYRLDNDAARHAAFQDIYAWLRATDEDTQRSFMRELCAAHGLNMAALCSELVMNWDELRLLAADPMVTIGAHTAGHYAIAKLDEERARREIVDGAKEIERQLGVYPQHFSFPYGDETVAGPRDFALAAELGFKTAVTTRKGMLFAEHADHLTALPRVSLNGEYQTLKYVDVFLSGAPFLLWNGFKRLNVA